MYTSALAARSGRFANALQQPAGVPFALSLSGVTKGSCRRVFREGKGVSFEVSEKTRAQVEEAYGGGHLAGKRSQRENWQVHREYKAPDDRAEYRKDEGLHHLLYCV